MGLDEKMTPRTSSETGDKTGQRSGQRIGLWGGSFNPPTLAHRAMADFVFDALTLDKLFWIVSPHNPEKDPATLAPFEHRVRMVEQAVIDHDGMQPHDIEQRNHSSWTIDTVRALRAEYPDASLFFIMGTDNWLNFHNWGRDFEQILDNVSLVVLNRSGYDSNETAESTRLFSEKRVASPDFLAPKGTWCIVENPQIETSATLTRTMLANGAKPTNIETEILDYIKENNLYLAKAKEA